jgi:nucleoid-associated protein EbfC
MNPLKGMGDLMKLMGQAGKIKDNLTEAHERARKRTVTGESGGGIVKVTANGTGEVLALETSPEALKDPESLGPLVVSAVNIALAKGKEVMLEETRTAMGGIDLPQGIL